MHKIYILKATKYYWEKLKTNKWEDISCFGSEHSIVLRCQFSQNWSIDSMQPQSKSQQITVDTVYMERQKIQNSQHYTKEEQSEDWHYLIPRLTIKLQ